MATTATDGAFSGEAYSRKEITERLEHFREMVIEAKAGTLKMDVAEVWEAVDHWLIELCNEEEIRCMCGDDCKEKAR